MFDLKQMELFAGIGGFGLGGRWTGIESTVQVEWNPYCRKILKKNFPNAIQHGDITTFDGTPYRGTIDIISGGFPCPPYSTAGKRLGESDDRALWPQMLRVIKEVAPRWVVGENVVGITNLDGGSPLRCFRDDLENIGYQVELYDIPAYSVGLQTVERHIWIIAKANGRRQQRSKKNKNKDDGIEREFQGANTGEFRRWNISETRFCSVGERVSRRMARHQRDGLKAVGNAIPPQVAYQIFKAIIQYEKDVRPTQV